MARSLWKGPISSLMYSANKPISRSSIISPSCIGNQYLVSNGKNQFPISVNLKMIGHKFGEFVTTRKFANHKKIVKKFPTKKK